MFSVLRNSGIASARRAFSTSPIARGDAAKITLLGRLAAEPEISTMSNGKEMIRYVVGVSPGRDQTPAWYKIVKFEPTEREKAYLASMPKGTTVMVDGDARLRMYDDDEGKKRVAFDVTERSITVVLRPKPKEPTEEES